MTSEHGLTLIELIVAMTVAAILAAVAIPGYRTIVISNRLSTTANDYVAALSEARLEAIKRNTRIQFCGLSGNTVDEDEILGSGCGSASGRIEVLNADGDGTELVRAQPAAAAKLTLTTVRALRFTGRGLAQAVGETAPFSGLIVEIDSDQISGRNRRCIYMVTGSNLVTCAVEAPECPDTEPNDC